MRIRAHRAFRHLGVVLRRRVPLWLRDRLPHDLSWWLRVGGISLAATLLAGGWAVPV